MQELEVVETARQAALLGKVPAPPAGPPAPAAQTITIDDFARIDMRAGVVLEAQAVKGANKLLQMKVDIGETQPRSIVAGIAEAYQPEDLVGRKVVIVANLEHRKVRGIPSQGMIVAASLEGGKPVLAGFHEDVPAGARLK
jgi:methionyl-tRNA synthetase